VALAVAALVLITGYQSITRHPKRYTSWATLIFLTSPAPTELEHEIGVHVSPAAQSPLARDDPRVVADIFERIYRGSAKHTQLEQAGFAGRLRVSTLRPTSSLLPERGPVFSILVDASLPSLAVDGAELVVRDVIAELAARQNGYDPRLSVGVVEVIPPTAPLLSSGSRVRVATAFAILAVLVFLTTPWMLGQLTSRRQRGPSQPETASRQTAVATNVLLER
jgi:hypothetical protein